MPAPRSLFASLFRRKGSLLVGSGPSAPVELVVGPNGQVLTADSTQPAGVKWAPGGGAGGVQSVDGVAPDEGGDVSLGAVRSPKPWVFDRTLTPVIDPSDPAWVSSPGNTAGITDTTLVFGFRGVYDQLGRLWCVAGGDSYESSLWFQMDPQTGAVTPHHTQLNNFIDELMFDEARNRVVGLGRHELGVVDTESDLTLTATTSWHDQISHRNGVWIDGKYWMVHFGVDPPKACYWDPTQGAAGEAPVVDTVSLASLGYPGVSEISVTRQIRVGALGFVALFARWNGSASVFKAIVVGVDQGGTLLDIGPADVLQRSSTPYVLGDNPVALGAVAVNRFDARSSPIQSECFDVVYNDRGTEVVQSYNPFTMAATGTAPAVDLYETIVLVTGDQVVSYSDAGTVFRDHQLNVLYIRPHQADYGVGYFASVEASMVGDELWIMFTRYSDPDYNVLSNSFEVYRQEA